MSAVVKDAVNERRPYYSLMSIDNRRDRYEHI